MLKYSIYLQLYKYTIVIDMNNLDRYGTIRCTAGNNWGAVAVEIELSEMTTRPAIVEPTYRSVTAIGGKQLMIPCKAVGIPKPRISWMLPNFDTLHRYEFNL